MENKEICHCEEGDITFDHNGKMICTICTKEIAPAPPVIEPPQKPFVDEVFADNGEHSHWVLIDPSNGEKLWSEEPEECRAMGYPVKAQPPQKQERKTAEEKLTLLKRNNPIPYRGGYLYEIHRGEILQKHNILFTTPDADFANEIVERFNSAASLQSRVRELTETGNKLVEYVEACLRYPGSFKGPLRDALETEINKWSTLTEKP